MQLKNATHERFAQLISEGKSGVDAYIDAGHEKVGRKSAGVSASRLLKNPDIKARIEELLERRADIEIKATEKAIEKLAISKERVLAEFANIAFADPGHYFDWGPDGVRVKDKDQLSADQRAVVSEVSQTVTENGGTIRVKLHSKLDALDKIARHLGLYKELHEVTGKDGAPLLGDASPRDVARAVLDILRQANVDKANGAAAPIDTSEEPHAS